MLALRWCVALLIFATLTAGEIKNKGWWKNAVFYQVYPRSFMDADDDGIGDLRGITDKLEHFKESGITAIWLSPIYASPMVDFGYDISDFRDIDSAYGTMEDFENLTKKAKQLGVKVIMDLVPNHTSDEHDWFIKSFHGKGKYKDYYVWREGKESNMKPPNNWISVFSGPAWTYNATRKLWYFHQFEYRQPDLNYTNPNVRMEMEEIIKFWLSKGIDGFRVDAIPHVYEKDGLPDEPRSNDQQASERDYNYLDHIYTKDDPRTYDLIQSWRNLMDRWADEHNEEEKVILTEAYTNLKNTTKFYKYGSHVPFNFNFIVQANNNSGPEKFKEIIDSWVQEVPPGNSSNWVMGNHDRNRLATRYPNRADQMTMLAMILPGVAVTYNGEEIGMEDKSDITWEETQDPQACNVDPNGNWKARSRDPVRTPFQWDDTKNAGFSKADKTWLPVHQNYKELNLAKQKIDPISHYKLYKSLTSLRNSSEVLKNGSLKTEILNGNDVLAVIRQTDRQSVILLINFQNEKSQKVDISSYTGPGNNVTIYVSSIGSNMMWNSMAVSDNIMLPGRASVVLISMLTKSGAAFLIVPIKLILSMALFGLFKQMF
ncbi:maltase 1-like [Copidosoma floridanum]|uniref:maltase 1-like n=1 Tax=Copidosoma floridanum TaxID=29053 RepID=UPI0006C9B2F2|nr:maltase 1-like [Copidosoma floridanum]